MVICGGMPNKKQTLAKKNNSKKVKKTVIVGAKTQARRKAAVGKVKTRAKKVGHVAKQTMLPTHANGGRPHLLRFYGLIAILILVIAVQMFYSWFIDGRVLGDKAEITQAKLVAETNLAREERGVRNLTVNSALVVAAEAKANDMFEKDYWDHEAPDGTKPWHWIEAAGYQYEEAGENLARGFNTAEGILAAWLDSPSHRGNVLGSEYTEVGFAVVNGTMFGKKTTLVVAMYGKPLTSATAVLGDFNATTQEGVVETSGEGIWVRLKRGIQSVTPSLMFVLVVLGIVTMVSIMAHLYRRRLPIGLRKEWHKHHVVYELAIIVTTGAGAVLSYGGGMI